MAKVWKKLQRADGDFTGTIAGTTASDVKDKAILGAGKPKTFKQNDPPTSLNIGDIWYDTNDNNIMYFAESVGADQIASGEWVIVKQGKGANTYTKTDVGLANVTNHAQIKDDGSNAPNILKNDQVSISAAGVLSGAGGGTVTASGVGAIKTDASNAPNSLKNAQISISSAGVLSGAGGGTVTASGVGAIQTDLGNAPTTIVNANTTATDVGLGSVANVRQNTTFYQDAIPTSLAVGDIWVDTNDSNKQYRADAVGADQITSGEWEAMHPGKIHTYTKGDVGLGSVSNVTTAAIREGVTKANVGLSNVEDKSMATILAGDLTGKVGTTSVADIQTGSSAGSAAKTVTDAAFDSSVKLKTANAQDGMINSNTTKTDVGLANVDNTSDAAKPVSTAQATSIATKAPTNNPTFTGTVGGVSKTHVGLSNVDNDSTSTIRSGTTSTHVGLGSVINQAVTVAGGKIKLDGTSQTIDADKVGGSTSAEVQAAAVTTAKDDLIGDAPGALDTLQEIADVFGDNENYAAGVTASIATKAKSPVTISNPATTPTEDVGVQGIYSNELYVVQDV